MRANKMGIIFALGLMASSAVFATDYYCDPATGSPTDPGTSDSPWRRLEEVFAAGKTFVAGDIIYLRNGNHGNPVINGMASGKRSIMAQPGHSPKMKTIRFAGGASNWSVDGVLVSPYETDGSFSNGTLVQFENGATNNTFQNSQVRSAPDSVAATWNNQNWVDRSCIMAISIIGSKNQVLNNRIRNVQNGIAAQRISTAGAGGTGSLVRGNSVDHFWEDAYRGKVSNCIFEYNYAANSYAVVPPGEEADPPHRDMFQGFRGDLSFTSVDSVVLRGNVFISRKGPRYTLIPYDVGKGANQGIGCFDGPYSGWTIENNVILIDNPLSIVLRGMDNGKILNNTVIPNPLGTSIPEIRITDQKDGTPSKNNIIRNNLSRSYNIGSAAGSIESNNLTVTSNFAAYFADYAGGDLHLKSGSPAVNAGTTLDAPKIDADKATRVAPYDVGAYEFGAVVPVIHPDSPKLNPGNKGPTLSLQGGIPRGYRVNGESVNPDPAISGILFYLKQVSGSRAAEIKAQ